MRVQPWLLASALGLVACAAAEPQRPRIYYPREVKREGFISTTSSVEKRATEATIDSVDSTKRDLLHDIVSGLLGGNDPDDESTSDKPQSTAKPKKPTDTGIVVGPTGIVHTKHRTKVKEPETTPAGLLEPVNTLVDGLGHGVGDLLGGHHSKTNRTKVAKPTKPPKGGNKPIKTETPSEDGGLIDGLTSLVHGILPGPTTTTDHGHVKTKTNKPPKTTHHGLIPGLTSIIGDLPTILDPTPTPSTEETNTTTGPTQVTTTDEGHATPTGTPTFTLPDIPAVNSTSTDDTSLPTEVPVTNTTNPDVTRTHAPTKPTKGLDTTTKAIHRPVVTSVESSTTETTVPVPTTTTDGYLPTTIVAEHTSFTFHQPTHTSSAGSTANPIPTSVPRVILPNHHDPTKPQPADSILIQIGFLYQLNYMFVAKNPVAASQIFKYLPKALSESGGFPQKNVRVNQLLPLDTKDTYGYITTIAQVYYPKNLVETLQMDLRAPASGFYHCGDEITRNLTAVVNPLIDLYGNMQDPSAAGAGNTADAGSNDSGDDPFSSHDNNDQTSKQKGMTAGIAVGAVSLGAIYGAAMFIVARRYKRKRQGHQRSSSVGGSSQASSEMRYTGAGSPALMGGALLSREFSGYGGVAGGRNSHNSHGSGGTGASNSARTANISAPLSAENSLGWN